MAEEAARSLTTHDEVDVDDMIAAQIREMEKEIKSEYRIGDVTAPTGGRGEEPSSSMAFGHGSLDLSKSYEGFEKKATLRDSLRSSLGLSMGGERPAEPRVEGTGLKGLLMSDFRLDASVDNVGDTIGGGYAGASGGGYSPGRGSREGGLAGVGAVNADMEKLLKLLHDDENFQSGKQNDIHVGSIGQVADMLETEMAGFLKVVGEREDMIDGVGVRCEERDEELREQGRAEARAKNLFGAAYTSATDAAHATATAEGPGVAEGGGLPSYDEATATPSVVPSRVDEVAALDAILGSESFVRSGEEGIKATAPDMDGAPSTSGPLPPRYPMTSPPVTTPASFAAAVGPSPGDGRQAITSLNRDGLNKALVAGWHPLQAAVDKEMSAADEILFRMRSLRTGLSSRLKHLDALSASVMTAPSSGNSAHSPAAGSGAEGIEAPAMLRSSREHWNGISRVNETAQAQMRETTAPQNVAPWTNKEQVPSEGDLSRAANSLASIGKEIGTNLDGSLNRLLTRLTDPSEAQSSSSQTGTPPNIPINFEMPPFDVACTIKCSNYHFYGACSHTDEISLMVRENISKALETAAAAQAAAGSKPAAPVAEPVSKPKPQGGNGPTLKELNAPSPPRSLLAQIDDLGSALGKSISVERNHSAPAEVQANAGTGFDKFLSNSTRANPFTQSEPQSSAPTPSSSSSVVGGKRKTLSPSPFRTQEAFVPPKLYAVRPVRSEAVPQRDDGTKKRIIAPSDEELVLRERLNTGAAGSESSQYVNIASAPAWVAKVPTLSPSSSYSSKYPGAPAVSPGELPWASEGGAPSTLRTRPVEGLAILSQREDAYAKRKEEARQAESAAIENVAAGIVTQNAPVMMPSVVTEGEVTIMEREKHLKAMKAMRLNLASIL